MAIQAEIIDKANNSVVDSQVFAVSVPTAKNTPYGGVLAANSATSCILDDIAKFCVGAIIYNQKQVELPKPSV